MEGRPRAQSHPGLAGGHRLQQFATRNRDTTESANGLDSGQRLLTARAQLTLAKWLDAAGQNAGPDPAHLLSTSTEDFAAWEKGHFFLGRVYKKLMESQQALPVDQQSDAQVQGELSVFSSSRTICGRCPTAPSTYTQTLPRIVTLWLGLGAQLDQAPDGKASLSRELQKRRVEQLNILSQVLGQVHRQAAGVHVLHGAAADRRSHRPPEPAGVRAAEPHPGQSGGGVPAAVAVGAVRHHDDAAGRSSSGEGLRIMQTLKGIGSKVDSGDLGLKQLLRMGEKLAEQLLLACSNGDFPSNRTTTASITKDLNFNHKCTPCPLVVPIEACLSATLPTLTDNVRKHKAFSRDVITIDSFLDRVLVLGSMAKPRKLTARGSDGKLYGSSSSPKTTSATTSG